MKFHIYPKKIKNTDNQNIEFVLNNMSLFKNKKTQIATVLNMGSISRLFSYVFQAKNMPMNLLLYYLGS